MNQSKDDSVKIILAKIGVLLAVGLLSFFFGLLPYYSVKVFRNRFSMSIVHRITTAVVCFSGGTLLGVTFLHLLPEVREKIARLQSEGNALPFPKSLPLSDIIAMAGFFGVYLLDEMLHMCVEWYSIRMKRLKVFDSNLKQKKTFKDKSFCSQLPQEVSAFSLDNHDYGKHQVSNSRRSSHRAPSIIPCVCQTSKSASRLGNDEKELNDTFPENSDVKSSDLIVSKDNPSVETAIREKSSTASPLSGLVTIAALSFHDVFEGMAIGIEQDLNSILFLYLSIASHKYAIAFCIGLDLVMASSRLKTIVLSMMTFSLVSPIGVIVGMGLISVNPTKGKYDVDSPVSAVMQGIAGGTLIYVVCFEVLQRQSSDTHKKGIQNVLFVICGFLLSLLFKIITKH